MILTQRKLTFIFLISEGILLVLYFHYQPLCEPCLPAQYCPPCIGDKQIFIRWLSLILAVVFLTYNVYCILRGRSKGGQEI